MAEYLHEAEQAATLEIAGIEMRAIGAMSYQFFHQRKASIKKSLKQTLGPSAACYEVRQLSSGRPALFGLDVEPGRIRFIDGIL